MGGKVRVGCAVATACATIDMLLVLHQPRSETPELSIFRSASVARVLRDSGSGTVIMTTMHHATGQTIPGHDEHDNFDTVLVSTKSACYLDAIDFPQFAAVSTTHLILVRNLKS